MADALLPVAEETAYPVEYPEAVESEPEDPEDPEGPEYAVDPTPVSPDSPVAVAVAASVVVNAPPPVSTEEAVLTAVSLVNPVVVTETPLVTLLALYQFSSASPRHSPTVTPDQPFALMRSK